MAQPEDFTWPEKIEVTDIVWLMDGNYMIGPLLVIDKRDIGYGSNRRFIWVLMDTETNMYYHSEEYWIRVPKEEK